MATNYNISKISINDYHYALPDERVAKYPLNNRDSSKLLQWQNGKITDHIFSELPFLLPQKSKLIFNNTKVIHARLHFFKATGAQIEIFLLDPVSPADYSLNFMQTEQCRWKCIVGNLKKWKEGLLNLPVYIDECVVNLKAQNVDAAGNARLIEFTWDNQNYSFSELIEAAGNIPIPPYLHRNTEEIDHTRYQTVFSKIKGSVAAPTAGLHFTENTFGGLKKQHISSAELTLHVGAGTFQPVKEQSIDNHSMHTEHFYVQKSLVHELINHTQKIIAVGTTSIRTLESLYQLGMLLYQNKNLLPHNLHISQWSAYNNKRSLTRFDIYNILLEYMEQNRLDYIEASTQIMIVPGYQFKIADGMLTNFHQPQSTLLLLIAAFLGEQWKNVYQHALDNNYRFLSYGDSNLYLKD